MIVFGLLATRQTLITVQQDGAPAHMARLAQSWIATNCSDFNAKYEQPPNLTKYTPLDYHVWGAMLECYKTFQPKLNTIDELKNILQSIWDDLPQNSVNKAIKRLWTCVKATDTHFEYVLR